MKDFVVTRTALCKYIDLLNFILITNILVTAVCLMAACVFLYSAIVNQHPLQFLFSGIFAFTTVYGFLMTWKTEIKLRTPLKYYIEETTTEEPILPEPEKYHVFVADDGTYIIKEE